MRTDGYGEMDAAEKPNILLIRDMPEDRSMSMERFADDLERGLISHGQVSVRSTAVRESRAARLGVERLDRHVARLLRYPLKVYWERADLYHIVDHGYAHVAALIPKERTIVTCHDVILLVGEEGLAGLRGRRRTVLRFRWTTSYLRRVACVVCVSQSTAADITRLCGVRDERIAVVPNG